MGRRNRKDERKQVVCTKKKETGEGSTGEEVEGG